MSVRMSSTTPQVADTEATEETLDAPRVRVVISVVGDADLDAALAVVRRQVYEPEPDIVVVGGDADGVPSIVNLEEAIGSTDPDVDYLWLLHSDARPRPDALAALVAESERNEASLAGSKLLKAGTMDELESVGGATDVFGEPYSGLDEGEIDLQQYDVVREVAFVQSASMLVRRDLAQGLRGLDPLLPPVAAGLDFSQRTRLAGGRVISVPSSEVYHQGRCGDRGKGWREQAGRLRAIVTAYTPLTLLWVLPYDFLVSVIDSLGSLLLGRWRPGVRHVYSWAWNTYHLPSTFRQRRRLRSVRAEGDEELFRFQARGSLRLRTVGEELSGRILSVFDDDQALARGSRRVWGSPGIWGAILAAGVVVFAARSIIFGGMPNAGYSFPFEAPSVALARWFGGWNESGLGAGVPVHPAVGLTGLVSFIWFGAEGAARTMLTLLLSLLGIVGMGRLGGRVGLRGPGRYLAGVVLMAGPGTALLVAGGSWLSLCAAAVLPWAVRACFVHPHEAGRSKMTYGGWALLSGLAVAAFSPVLALVPLIVVLVWRALGGDRASVLLGLIAFLGGLIGLGFIIGDLEWLLDPARRLGVVSDDYWLALILIAALPMLVIDVRGRLVAMTGGILALAALAAGRLAELGPGFEEPVFVTASFGAAFVVSGVLDGLSRNVFRWMAVAGGLAIVVTSVVGLSNGRLGLPAGDDNARLAFAATLSEESGPGRILHASVDRSLIPGEVRSGPGFWYRVLDGSGTTIDEVWLPQVLDGDEDLASSLADIASGAELRPGDRLAPFAVDWVVLEGPEFVLDEVFLAQLDLVPLPLDPTARVYENDRSVVLADSTAGPWMKDGVGFRGDATSGRVTLAVNYDEGWQPDPQSEGWWVTVAATDGEASWVGDTLDTVLAGMVIGLIALSAVAVIAGRRRS